jgi:hypothetical protein
MHVEGFAGQVVVGFGGGIEFNKATVPVAITTSAPHGSVHGMGGVRPRRRGKLGLTTSMAELFRMRRRTSAAITIEQLLGHTADWGARLRRW